MNLRRWDLLAVVAVGLGHPLKKDQFPDCNLLDRQSNQNIPIMSEYFFFRMHVFYHKLNMIWYTFIICHYQLKMLKQCE